MAVLFKDDFSGTLSQWTTVATQGTLAISGGKARATPNGAGPFGVLGMYTNSNFPISSGATLAWEFTANTNTIGNMMGFLDLGESAPDQISYAAQRGIYFANPGTEIYKNSGGQTGTGNIWSAGTTYTTTFTVGATTISCSVSGGGYTNPIFSITHTLPGQSVQIALDVSTFYAAGYAEYNNVVLTDNGSLSPQIPTNLAAAGASATTVTVSFTDNGTAVSETGVSIERSATGGGSGFSEIATVSQGVGTYTDTGRTPGVLNYYRARSYLTFDGTTYYSSYTSETTGSGLAGGGGSGDLLELILIEDIIDY